MCLNLLESKHQRDERLLRWQQDTRRLGDVTLECRDARGELSHCVTIARASSPGGQQVVQAVLRDHPDRDDRGQRRPWMRDRDALDRRAAAGARQQPVTSALLARELSSHRIAQPLRRGLGA